MVVGEKDIIKFVGYVQTLGIIEFGVGLNGQKAMPVENTCQMKKFQPNSTKEERGKTKTENNDWLSNTVSCKPCSLLSTVMTFSLLMVSTIGLALMDSDFHILL